MSDFPKAIHRWQPNGKTTCGRRIERGGAWTNVRALFALLVLPPVYDQPNGGRVLQPSMYGVTCQRCLKVKVLPTRTPGPDDLYPGIATFDARA